MFQRQAISEVIFHCVEEGDRVYSRLHGWAIIVLKERSGSKRLPRIWLELEDRLEIIEPCYLRSLPESLLDLAKGERAHLIRKVGNT